MKIALDAYHAAREHGGIARYVRGLSNALFAAECSHDFVLFSNRFRDASEWNPNLQQVSTVRLNAPRRLMQGLWDCCAWPPVEYWTGSVDIYHGMHFVLPAVRAAKLVLTVHDLTFLKHPEFFSDTGLNARGYQQELPAALARADAVIAVSQSTKHDLMTLMDYPEAKIRVIHEGVEPHFFVDDKDLNATQILANYGLDRPYMIFLVGTPEPRKNLMRTIGAAKLAAPEMAVAVVGDAAAMRLLLGAMAGDVHFLGEVPDSVLPTLLHAAEISLYPTLYEGFGLPVLESMAAAVPVITSNISACPEVGGSVAMLVDPYDQAAIAEAIRSLLADDDRRQKMREDGVERAAQFSWQRCADEVLKLYGELH
ncbi:MAG: glycosyltransferase family 1 protein [Mariprofundales bacterium]